MKCPTCGQGELRHETTTRAYTYGLTTLLIKNLEGNVCSNCSSIFVNAETAERIQADLQWAGEDEEQLIVRDYRTAPARRSA
jgi:YgiT-type zinc finger domain-containing protein